MACQLALLFLRRLEVPVVLTDLDQERVDKGVGYVHARDRQAARQGPDQPGQGQPAQGAGHRLGWTRPSSRTRTSSSRPCSRRCGSRRQVFAELEEVVRPDAILATNTSSLSVTEMAAELEHPERVVGFHFFNPVAVLPLLEIVRARPDRRRVAGHRLRGRQDAEEAGVLVKDAPAFVVNRLLTRFLGEVSAAVDEGTPVAVADKALSAAGPADAAVRAAAAGRSCRSRCTSRRP